MRKLFSVLWVRTGQHHLGGPPTIATRLDDLPESFVANADSFGGKSLPKVFLSPNGPVQTTE